MGVVLTARAGYDLYALPVVLQEIGHASQERDARLLFKTHPHPNDRLDHLATAMDTLTVSGMAGEKALYWIK
jgi:predicted Zn-dependent protease